MELLADRQRFDEALYQIALALPQSCTGIEFTDDAIPAFADDSLIRYIMERVAEVVLPGQTVPSLAPYRAELAVNAVHSTGAASPFDDDTSDLDERTAIEHEPVSRWTRLRNPEV